MAPIVRADTCILNPYLFLPDLADSARLYMRLLEGLKGAGLSADCYENMQRAAAALVPDDNSLEAERARGRS
jgi:amidase